MHKAVFFDRDGVLNNAIVKAGKPYPPANLHELSIPSDAFAALTRLKSDGYLLLGATNQPDVARGKTTVAIVDAINAELMHKLPLDDIAACYHDDADNCACRKPKPGLLLKLAEQFGIDLSKSVMVGDRFKDIEAGINAGCKTIWLQSDYDEPGFIRKPDFVARSLTAASAWILGN